MLHSFCINRIQVCCITYVLHFKHDYSRTNLSQYQMFMRPDVCSGNRIIDVTETEISSTSGFVDINVLSVATNPLPGQC